MMIGKYFNFISEIQIQNLFQKLDANAKYYECNQPTSPCCHSHKSHYTAPAQLATLHTNTYQAPTLHGDTHWFAKSYL